MDILVETNMVYKNEKTASGWKTEKKLRPLTVFTYDDDKLGNFDEMGKELFIDMKKNTAIN